MSATIDQQFIEFIVKSLVGKPEAVVVERRIDEKGVLLELTVDAEDLGRVIGKRGATAQSLRTLLRALGTKNDARYNLKIVDVNGGPSSSAGSSTEDDAKSKKGSNKADNTEDEADAESEGAQVEDVVNDEPAETTTEEPDELDLDDDDDEVSGTDSESDTSDVVSKTRKELQDLDDLDL